MNQTMSRHSLSSLQEIMTTVVTELIPSAPSASPARETRRELPSVSTTPLMTTSRSGAATRRDDNPRASSPEMAPKYALFIAIDWADKKHDVCVLDPDTQQRTHHEVEQTPKALHAWLQDLHQRVPGQTIAVALEQKTGALINFLLEFDWIDVYPVNPVTLSRYRKALHVSGAKDDPTDAHLLLDLLSLHRNTLRRLTPDTPLTRSLQRLTRQRREAVAHRTRFNNQLKQLLKEYFPLFLKVCGEELFAPMACELLLKYPCFEALKQADPQELRQFYVSHGSWRPEVIARRLTLIREAMPLTTDEAIIRSAIVEATMLAQLLLTVADSIKAFDRLIADLFAQHEDAPIFASFPGAGPILAPRLLAAFGTNRQRFETATEVQNTMGISPVKKESGNTKIVVWRAVCSKFLRQSFHEYANESIHQSIWARAYYQQQRDKGNGHHAAIRALAFKWSRIMFRCWQTRRPYDELRYLSALQRRHAPLLDYLSKSDQFFGIQRR
jgi:transposase